MKKMNLFLTQAAIVAGLFFAVSCCDDDEVILAVGVPYQGGVVAYLDATGEHGLIAMPVDGFIPGSTVTTFMHSRPDIYTGATYTAYGKGQDNTLQIVAVMNEYSVTEPYAAKLCKDFDFAGYRDWFLPSKDELNKLYENRALIGGFSNEIYWSSSESADDSENAWAQSFSNGVQSEDNKGSAHRARAVRGF